MKRHGMADCKQEPEQMNTGSGHNITYNGQACKG